MLIVYSDDSGEVLVCKKKSEKEFIKTWFKKGGRTLEDYDREEYPDEILEINSSVHIDC